MIAHTNKSPSGKLLSVRFEREGWKEWFRIPISGQILRDKMPLPPGYAPTHSVIQTDVWWFWRKPLHFIVRDIQRFRILWWNLAKTCYKKGLIKNIKEGERVRFWWPIKLLF